MRKPYSPGSHHRVDLGPVAGRLEQRLSLRVKFTPRLGDHQVSDIRKELMQGRVQEPHRHRQAIHRLEDALEVRLLDSSKLFQGICFDLGGLGQDHRPDEGQPVGAEEHVLRSTQADADRTGLSGSCCVLSCIRVRPDPEGSGGDLVGPVQDRVQLGRHHRLDDSPVTQGHRTGGSVN